MTQSPSALVLYVEPDAGVREEVQRYFTDRASGISIVAVPTIREGRARLEQDDITCVVSEYAFPETSGLELLDAVRDDYPTLPFIFYTTSPASDLVEEAFRLGATDYVQKGTAPAHHRILERRIEIATSTGETTGDEGSIAAETASRFVEEAPIGFLSFDTTGEITFANAFAESVLGRPAAELTGLSYDASAFDIVDSEGKPVPNEELPVRRVLTTETPLTDVELGITTGAQQRVWISVNATPLYTDGEMTGIAVTFQDVTERKEAERRLQQTLEEYETVFENAQDAIFLLDVENGDTFRISRLNPAEEGLIGHATADVEGKTLYDLYDEETADRAVADYRRCVEKGEPITSEKAYRLSGETRTFQTNLAPVVCGGEVTQLVGITRDVTERKEREQQVRERERELAQTKRLLEQSQRLAKVGAWEIKVEDGEPSELTATDEAYRINDLSPGTEITLEEALGYYRPEDEARVRAGVERAIREGESYDYEVQLTTPKGNERWVRTIGEPIRTDGEVLAVRGAIQDITESKRREEELERTKILLDSTEQIANVGGWEIDVRGEPPFDGTQTDGLYRLHGISTDEDFPIERGMEFVHPDDREDVEGAVERLLLHGEPFDIERRIVTADGEIRWVRGRGVPVVEDGEIVKYRGAMADITERKRSERAFALLYDAAHRLLAATTDGDVAQVTVDTAEDLLSLPYIVLYRFDSNENGFVPLAHSTALESQNGSPPVIHGSDRSLISRAFFGNETLELSDVHDSPYLYDEDTPIRRALLIPLGEHGILVAGDATPGEFDTHATTVTELLGTTVRAALGRLIREQELHERQWELEQKTTQLERLNQLNELIRGIDRRLVEAESRDELEAAVCEQLVASDRYTFAWIGEYDTRTQTVVPRSWAGTEHGYLGEIHSLSTDEKAVSEPAHRTARTYEPTLISNVADGLRKDRWRREALSRGYQSVLSVPLLHDEIPYGVLTVYSTRTNAFDPLVRTVFEELGGAIANAVNNVETKRGLVADQVVELELEAHSTNEVLHQLANRADCSLTVETVLPVSGDRYRVFFTTPASATETVRTAAESSPSIDTVQILSTGGERTTFQATLFEPPVALRLAEQGAVPQQITTDGDTLAMTVEVPTTTDVRTFVEVLQGQYPDLEMVARREMDRPIRTREEFYRTLTTQLTDRQFEVLTAAYHGGYFESPRLKTGEEIAELLGVTQPTFNYHLRRAFKRLLALILSETGGVRTLDT